MRRIFLIAIYLFIFLFVFTQESFAQLTNPAISPIIDANNTIFNTVNKVSRQILPRPGSNCGVGYKPETKSAAEFNGSDLEDKGPDLNSLDNQIYACCEGFITEENIKQSIANGTNPVVNTTIDVSLGPLGPLGVGNIVRSVGGLIFSDKLKQVVSVVGDGMIDFPQNLFGNFSPVPSVGMLLNVYKDGNKCISGAGEAENFQGQCYCKAGASSFASFINMCKNISTDSEKKACLECAGIDTKSSKFNLLYNIYPRNGGNAGVWTSIGCVQADLPKFIQETVLGLAIGFVGLVSLLCIIYSSFILQTSAGDPERVKKAQELLTSCITGLMMVILSVFILRLIGVTILQIPGFTN